MRRTLRCPFPLFFEIERRMPSVHRPYSVNGLCLFPSGPNNVTRNQPRLTSPPVHRPARCICWSMAGRQPEHAYIFRTSGCNSNGLPHLHEESAAVELVPGPPPVEEELVARLPGRDELPVLDGRLSGKHQQLGRLELVSFPRHIVLPGRKEQFTARTAAAVTTEGVLFGAR